MKVENQDTFILNDYGRLPELVNLLQNGRGFSIIIPRHYPKYAAAVRLVDERFGSKNASKWSSIRDSWSVGKDFSFFSLGFNNDRYNAARIEQEDGLVVQFIPR